MHGRGGSIIKYGFDKAKYTAVFESMRGLGQTAKGGDLSNYHKFFMLCQQVEGIAKMLSPYEDALNHFFYQGDYGENKHQYTGPQVTAGSCMRVFADTAPDFVPQQPENNQQPDPHWANQLNDAPALAFNRLLGEKFLRSKMEAVWMKGRASKQHAAQACIDYLVDGGLRGKAFTHGDRIPYVGADLKVHPIAVAPVGSLSLHKIILMATDPHMFNLLVAGTVKCRNAMIRLDTIEFMDSRNQYMRPRICSSLLTLRRVTTPANDEIPKLEYHVSVNGGAFASMFVAESWAVVKQALQDSDFGRFYVPTDFSANMIKAAFLRELSKE